MTLNTIASAMAFRTSSPALRNLTANSLKLRARRSESIQQTRFYAQQSYGSGEGDPKGENPQQQGSNPSADLEHPGPPPPDVGKGTGGGPTKAGNKGQSTEQHGPSGGSGTSGSKQSSSGAQPKIHSASIPTEASEGVKKHNEEFEQRKHGKATNEMDHKGKDNVGKGFWSGMFSLESIYPKTTG